MPTAPPETPAAFEAAMDALEALVTRMESGDLPLEESLREYQRGMELVRSCQESLDEAQRRIEHVMEASSPSATGTVDPNGATKVPDNRDLDDIPF